MKRPWMPLYVVDFQLDTLDLNPDELGIYFVMILMAWRRGDGSISGNMQELKVALQCRFRDLHGLTFNRIVPKLLDRYFEFRDGKYYQKRVEKELRKAGEISEKQSRIAKERWSKDNKINDITNANAMPSQLQLHTHIQREDKKETRARALADPWSEADWKQFWETYPHKIGKAAARKAFEKASKNVTPGILFPALEQYANKTDDRPFCNPATWLNQERWLDQPAKFNGRRTVQQAADDLLAKIQSFDGSNGLCDGTGENIARLLPPRRSG